MADFDSSLPVRTENDGDVVAIISDATITSQKLTVNADGSINVTDNGGSLTVDGTVTVTATDLDIRDLSASQDNVAISDGTDTLAVNADGSLNITDNGGSLTVDATDLDIRDLDSAQDSVEVLQATHDNLNANVNLQVGDVDVANGNPVPVSDAGGSLTVDATDLDIRDLTHVSDSVKLGDGTDFVAVNADGSLNITDNGGSLTVDGTVTVTATDLDIRDLDATQDNVAISDGTDTLAVNVDGSINSVVTATDLDIRDLTHVSDSVKIGDGTDFLAIDASGNIGVTDAGGSLTVDATDLDIRDLTHVSDSIKIGDGTDLLSVNADGSINVKVVDGTPGTSITDYDTTAAVAGGASDTHTYTSTGNFYLTQIEASGSGKLKIEVQVNGATKFVQFNSTANPNMTIQLSQPVLATTGQTVTVIRTNRDNQAQDVYSTISGYND